MASKIYDEKTKWLMHEIRRLHSKWKPRKNVKVNARISRGKYKCLKCEGIYGPREIDLDHIEPVISVEEGFIDWNTYINRLFVDEEGYQVLCKSCHKQKTHEEENKKRWN